jgi:hypothetical protein
LLAAHPVMVGDAAEQVGRVGTGRREEPRGDVSLAANARRQQQTADERVAIAH